MSDTVKLSSRLPGDPEINGLDPWSEQLHEDITLVAVAWLTPRDVRRVIATGAEVPTVEIRRIEVFGTPSMVPQVIIDEAQRIQETRTGRTPLPFDELVVPKRTDDDDDDEAPAGEVGTVPAGDVAEQILARDPGEIADVFAFTSGLDR